MAAGPVLSSAEPTPLVRVMIIDFQAKGVDTELARTLTDTVATALAGSGRFSVAGQDDVAEHPVLQHLDPDAAQCDHDDRPPLGVVPHPQGDLGRVGCPCRAERARRTRARLPRYGGGQYSGFSSPLGASYNPSLCASAVRSSKATRSYLSRVHQRSRFLPHWSTG